MVAMVTKLAPPPLVSPFHRHATVDNRAETALLLTRILFSLISFQNFVILSTTVWSFRFTFHFPSNPGLSCDIGVSFPEGVQNPFPFCNIMPSVALIFPRHEFVVCDLARLTILFHMCVLP